MGSERTDFDDDYCDEAESYDGASDGCFTSARRISLVNPRQIVRYSPGSLQLYRSCYQKG